MDALQFIYLFELVLFLPLRAFSCALATAWEHLWQSSLIRVLKEELRCERQWEKVCCRAGDKNSPERCVHPSSFAVLISIVLLYFVALNEKVKNG